MKAALIWIFSILCANASSRIWTADDALNQKIWTLDVPSWDREEQAAPPWLTPEIKPLVVEKLLKWRQESDSTDKIDRILVALGHWQTIKKCARELEAGNHQTALEGPLPTAREESIHYLMPFIDSSSTTVLNTDRDTLVYSTQQRFASAILHIIIHRDTFPRASRDWAVNMNYALSCEPVQERIGILKLWWKHNERAVLEKRYAEAAWLPLYKGAPSYIGLEEIRDRSKDRELRTVIQDHPTIVTAGSIGHEPAQSIYQGLWIAIAALFILLAGFLVWKTKAFRNVGRG